MKIFIFLLPYLFTGLAASLAAVLIERLMIHIGWTPGNTLLTIFSVFILTVLFQLTQFPEPISFDWYLFLGLFMGLMIANRYNLSITLQKGKWWWKSKSNEQK